MARTADIVQDLGFARNALFPTRFPTALVYATPPMALRLQRDARPTAFLDTSITLQSDPA